MVALVDAAVAIVHAAVANVDSVVATFSVVTVVHDVVTNVHVAVAIVDAQCTCSYKYSVRVLVSSVDYVGRMQNPYSLHHVSLP